MTSHTPNVILQIYWQRGWGIWKQGLHENLSTFNLYMCSVGLGAQLKGALIPSRTLNFRLSVLGTHTAPQMPHGRKVWQPPEKEGREGGRWGEKREDSEQGPDFPRAAAFQKRWGWAGEHLDRPSDESLTQEQERAARTSRGEMLGVGLG